MHVISSANGLSATNRITEQMRRGTDVLDAVVAGINEVEDDPQDTSVGYGGLPNADGVVELDAAVMHGPTHQSGAVAARRNIRNHSLVAVQVMRRTGHVLLVGQAAFEFARSLGFPEQDLLTDTSRAAWLKWKANLNHDDDWLDDDQRADPRSRGGPVESIPFTEGTIHVSAVDDRGDLAACTSTSGLSYKIPGRVGDSPIVGAGLFLDNAVGSAGSTGRGEAVIESVASFEVVRHMADGIDPTEACLRAVRSIVRHTRRPYLQNSRGEPDFQVTMYALRKDGACGAACLRKGKSFAVHDGTQARLEPCAYLFE